MYWKRAINSIAESQLIKAVWEMIFLRIKTKRNEFTSVATIPIEDIL